MYRALIPFCDLQDNGRSYDAGETFPRSGLRVTAERLKELSTNENRMGFPLIEKVPDVEKKPTRKRVKKDD